ncbi:MAG: hypothetical protein E7128_04695 [Rikenellaceae bacterium]|nr:hypothetical protein [Rikenellaceae bacterium]
MKTNFKKVMFLPALVALFSMVFVGCNNTPEPTKDSSIEVATESISLEQTKGAKATVDVTANCEWIVSPDVNWIQVPSKQGNGNGTVTVIARTANDEIGSRSGNITITSKDGKATKTVAVVQLGLGAVVELSATEVALENAPEAANGVTVTSNVDWELSQEGDWFTVEQAAAGSRTQLTITAKGYNETLEAVTGKVILTYTDGTETKTAEIAVSQAACVPSLVAEPASVVFATTAAGETAFTLTAAGTWSIVAPEWATVTPTSGASGETTVTVKVGANDAIEERAGVIAITGLGDAAIDVPVNQAGNAPKVTCEDAVSVDCADGTANFTINANYGWSANSSADWLECEPGQGDAGETVVTLKYVANAPSDQNTGKERTATLTITCTTPDGKATTDKEVTVTQAAFDGDDLSAEETANCYITTKTGYPYKFKATVKGNGQADEEGYITVTPINLNVTGLQAIELWRDNQTEILSNIRLDKEKGYIMFDVNENAPKGNTVIALAVMDEFDPTMTVEVLWSWHIWTANEDVLAKAMPITYPGTVKPAVDVVMMDRNLGATSNGTLGTDEDIVASYGLHYEWGRKDPFPGCQELISPYKTYVDGKTNYMSSTRIPLYRTVDGVPQEVTHIFQGIGMGGIYEMAVNNGETPDENVTIDYAIANPTTYITGGGSEIAYNGISINGRPASWLYVPEGLRSGAEPEENGGLPYGAFEWQTYLWGNSNNAITGTTYGTKTIYDPCPAGWRVPDRNAFAFVITAGGYSPNPIYKDGDGNIFKSINCSEEFVGWDHIKDGAHSTYVADEFGSQYQFVSDWNTRNPTKLRNESKYEGFKAGYHIYTGGYQTGETMFFPMSGTFSYDSGNPCSDYSGFGSYASYATNAQDGYRAYNSRLEIYAPSTYLTDNWSWEDETRLHAVPGACGSPMSSFHQAAGYAVRCMKDVIPTEVGE